MRQGLFLLVPKDAPFRDEMKPGLDAEPPMRTTMRRGLPSLGK